MTAVARAEPAVVVPSIWQGYAPQMRAHPYHHQPLQNIVRSQGYGLYIDFSVIIFAHISASITQLPSTPPI
jgi:hypothetical protein